jgi:hypothetical protein
VAGFGSRGAGGSARAPSSALLAEAPLRRQVRAGVVVRVHLVESAASPGSLGLVAGGQREPHLIGLAVSIFWRQTVRTRVGAIFLLMAIAPDTRCQVGAIGCLCREIGHYSSCGMAFSGSRSPVACVLAEAQSISS